MRMMRVWAMPNSNTFSIVERKLVHQLQIVLG